MMSNIYKLSILLCCVLLFCETVLCESNKANKSNENQNQDSSKTESEEKGEAKEVDSTLPTEVDGAKEDNFEQKEEMGNNGMQEVTSAPEEDEEQMKSEESEKITEKEEESITEKSINLAALFDEANEEDLKDEEYEKETPPKMEGMKEKVRQLLIERNEKQGLPTKSIEEFDKDWQQMKNSYGKIFPFLVEKISIFKSSENNNDENFTHTSKEATKFITESSAPELVTEAKKEEAPEETFAVWNSKGKICLLAKLHAEFSITYPSKGGEEKADITLSQNGKSKGNCGSLSRSPRLQISWDKFVFTLTFNKTAEENWAVTAVELTYDTSANLFDGAVNRGKITARSKDVSLFETPFQKSYFCPAQEVVLLYSGKKHVVTARLKNMHLQPYQVEGGKFSVVHRCNQVVIGGPEEEPFVQDETIPLAVGCTLALITLLILVGFSVHRAYHAAKVDYNTME